MVERNLIITGIGGLLGRAVLREIAARNLCRSGKLKITGIDLLPANRFEDFLETENLKTEFPGESFEYISADIRKVDWGSAFSREEGPVSVLHFAAILEAPPGMSRQVQYEIDVESTEKILEACIEKNVEQIIVTTSGAAYGYHADNPDWLSEDDAIRGNEDFAYSHHKKLVENMLQRYREKYPDSGLKQLVFRPGTVLGSTVRSPVSRLFEGKKIPAIKGSDSPFVFIWDEDAAKAILKGVEEEREGIFNLTADGAVGLSDIATMTGKPLRSVPAWLMRAVLFLGRTFRLSRYGPEQVKFLQFRPKPDNKRLKTEFGYIPALSSHEAFSKYLEERSFRELPAVSKTERAFFKDRLVVISGGGGGIGIAFALRMGAAGAKIVLLDLDSSRGQRALKGLLDAGIQAEFFSVDTTDREGLANVFQQIGSEKISVLINNAGISHRSLFSETDPSVLEKVWAVNVKSAINCSHFALPGIIATKGGIMNISSVAGFSPLYGRTGYSMAKYALEGFSQSLRSELPDFVTSTVIFPSFIRTGFDRNTLDASGNALRKPKPLIGKPMEADVLAKKAVTAFLKRKSHCYPSWLSFVSYWLWTLFPEFYIKQMKKRVEAEFLE